MDLYCCETTETENEIRAYDDPTLLQDRVLKNLLKTEDRYVLPYPANFAVQKGSHPGNEKNCSRVDDGEPCIDWPIRIVLCEITSDNPCTITQRPGIIIVCEEQKCQDEVFSLAVNYMDRFLMCCSIMKNQLQLLGTTCMLLASKLRESKPLAGETLVYYTDHSVTKQQLWKWELLVLSKLKWDMAAVTPHDFLKHLLNRLPMEDNWNISYEMVLSHAKTLITLCAREFVFSRYHPSIIACASIASALNGIGWVCKSGQSLEDLLQRLTEITCIEKDYVEQCLVQIDKMVRESTGLDCETQSIERDECENTIRPGEFTPPPGKNQDHQAALTPTDVHDVHF